MEEMIEASFTSHESLEDLDWDGLLEVCKEKDEKLNLAGTYGMRLFEQLNEAQNHIEEMRVKHEAEMERLVQETFELKSKLELRDKSLQYESVELQKQLQKKHEEEIEEAISRVKKEQGTIKKERDSLANELEQSQLREQHAFEQVQRLEERIAELQLEVKKKVENLRSETDEIDKFEFEEKQILMEEEIEKLTGEVKKLQNENQSIDLKLKSKINETVNLNAELEQIEFKSTGYYNHLQKAREENNELKAELDILKNEMGNSGHLKQGNSLFGEVDDERREMEKKLSSFQIKYESLSKAHAFLMSQNRNMKAQVLSLLQMNSGKADGERIAQLERALSQANAENQSLMKKIKEAETKQEFSAESLKALSKDVPDVKSNRDMIDFLLIQIEETKGKHNKLREEFEYLSMVKLAESEKLRQSEQRLYEIELQSEKFRNDNMKLKLKLEETKNKLQGETQKRIMIEKKFNYDSKDDIVPLGIVHENQSNSKKIIPATLAKAQEKAMEKRKSSTPKFNELWQSRENILKSISKKGTPKIDDSTNVFDENKENIFNNETKLTILSSVSTPQNEIQAVPTGSSSQQKYRKVSFKEETETIPECKIDGTILEEEPSDPMEKEKNSSNTDMPTSETKTVTNSALKKKEALPLRQHLQPKQENVNKESCVKPLSKTNSTHQSMKAKTNKEHECKMQ